MNKDLSDFLNDMNGTKLGQHITKLSSECYGFQKQFDNAYEEAEAITKKLDKPAQQIKQDGHDTLSLATALTLRAQMMMFESEPRHKCEAFLQILKEEVEKYEKSIPHFFDKKEIEATSVEEENEI